MKLALLVLIVACGGDHGGTDAYLACSTDCRTPPGPTCSGSAETQSYGGICTNGVCVYSTTTTACQMGCSGDHCAVSEVDCNMACHDITSCNGNILSTMKKFCPTPQSFCSHDAATTTDCSTLMTPPPPDCSGTVANTYAATGSCMAGSGSAACGYAKTSVDCATTNQTCTNGACVGP